jgi:hypothetical protein
MRRLVPFALALPATWPAAAQPAAPFVLTADGCLPGGPPRPQSRQPDPREGAIRQPRRPSRG